MEQGFADMLLGLPLTGLSGHKQVRRVVKATKRYRFEGEPVTITSFALWLLPARDHSTAGVWYRDGQTATVLVRTVDAKATPLEWEWSVAKKDSEPMALGCTHLGEAIVTAVFAATINGPS